MSQIVITGSQGFIGKHLVKYYQDLDQNVISIDNLEGPITDKWLSSNYAIKNPENRKTL